MRRGVLTMKVSHPHPHNRLPMKAPAAIHLRMSVEATYAEEEIR